MSDVSTDQERKRWASAQRRRRARAKSGQTVFHLALHSHLVALALSTSRFAESRDLTSHEQCEAALTMMVEQTLLAVIDDCSDEDVRVQLTEIKSEMVSRITAA